MNLASCAGRLMSATSSPGMLSGARTTWPLLWLDLAEGRLRLDRLAATAAVRLSSPGLATPRSKRAGTPVRPFLASQESLSAAILRCAPAPRGASSIACGLSIAIEAAMVAGSNSQGEVGATRRVGLRRSVSLRLFPNRTCKFPGIRLSMRGSHRGCRQSGEAVERTPQLRRMRMALLWRCIVPAVGDHDASSLVTHRAAIHEAAKSHLTLTPD